MKRIDFVGRYLLAQAAGLLHPWPVPFVSWSFVAAFSAAMEPQAKQRKRNAVGNLRELASELGLDTDRAGVGRRSDLTRDDFTTLHTQVSAHSTSPEHKARADAAMQLYLGSAPAPAALPQAPPLPGLLPQIPGAANSSQPAVASGADQPPEDGFRLRSSACLFTWNGQHFARTGEEQLWSDFIVWLSGLDFLFRWTATLERSLRSKDTGRLHLHAYVEFLTAPDWTTLEKVRFAGSLPNASPMHARGEKESLRTVKNQGHFYCWAWKPGTVKVKTTSYEPWLDYPVKGCWLDDLWSQHKLDHQTYLDYAAKVRVGYVNRCRQVEAVMERERAKTLCQRRAEVALQLAPLRKAFKPSVLQQLRPWKQQYDTKSDRYMFLVLRGASRTGKSTLARGLGVAMNIGSTPFVQTVQSAITPDLRNYKPEVHDYIVFDNVNDMKFILDYRALFQANNDIHTLGDSKTGIYSYDIWLFKVPMVVTVDMSAKWDPMELWIKDNCFDVFLDGPSWQDGS